MSRLHLLAFVAAVLVTAAFVRCGRSALNPSQAASLEQGILTDYLGMQSQLIADGTEGVGNAARLVASKAERLGAKAAAIAGAAHELERAASLDQTREAYSRLSQAVMEYGSGDKASVLSGVRVAYCPMLNKKWLQKGTEIRNPYAGPKMLDCGVLE